jgi:4-diphosphocytidyl-2-C-methyl-D-erythritol kinase
MRIRTMPGGRLVVHAPAKVNLFLEVLSKRDDGYHELETLMVAVNLYDTLVFQEDESGAIEFRSDDAAIPQGPQNLVVRSALLVREEAKATGRGASGAKIWLRKRIPVAAGLGGGSSDAAATLAALNTLWKLGLSLPQLATLGARIGSDVPFFFHTPAAVGRGRGELLTPVSLPRPLHLVLVCPTEGVSTAEVYTNLDRSDPTDRLPIGPILDAVNRGDLMAFGKLLFNRLEATACQLCPAVAAAHDALRATGLAGPLVTGSGSASFGLAMDRRVAVEAARTIRERFPGRVIVTHTTP